MISYMKEEVFFFFKSIVITFHLHNFSIFVFNTGFHIPDLLQIVYFSSFGLIEYTFPL